MRTHTYQAGRGLLPLEVTEYENNVASDVAVELLVSLGGNADTHGDRDQTLVMMGVVAGQRAFREYITQRCDLSLSGESHLLDEQLKKLYQNNLPSGQSDMPAASDMCSNCDHVFASHGEVTANGVTDRCRVTGITPGHRCSCQEFIPEGVATCNNCGKITHTAEELRACIASMTPDYNYELKFLPSASPATDTLHLSYPSDKAAMLAASEMLGYWKHCVNGRGWTDVAKIVVARESGEDEYETVVGVAS